MEFAPKLSQADYRWASKTLNKESFKLHGCLVTALTSKTAYESRKELSPVQLDAYLDAHKGYVDGTDILNWEKALEWMRTFGLPYTSMVRQQWLMYMPTAPAIEPKPQILEVETSAGHQHFVVLIATLNSEAIIMDPATSFGIYHTCSSQKYDPRTVRLLR